MCSGCFRAAEVTARKQSVEVHNTGEQVWEVHHTHVTTWHVALERPVGEAPAATATGSRAQAQGLTALHGGCITAPPHPSCLVQSKAALPYTGLKRNK